MKRRSMHVVGILVILTMLTTAMALASSSGNGALGHPAAGGAQICCAKRSYCGKSCDDGPTRHRTLLVSGSG